jgi:hypothetical protein
MTMQRLTTAIVCALAASVGLAGCGSDPAPTGTEQVAVDDYESIDFNLAYGGLTATDEEAAFGDPYLLQTAAADEGSEANDPLAADPEVARLERLAAGPGEPNDPARPRFTFLRMTWGMLDGPVDELGNVDDSVDLVDWSGALWVDRGLVIVRRVILFERPYDHLIWPRIDRRTIGWVSHTGCHFDGLLIEIIEPPLDPAAVSDPPEPNRLHFESGPFSGAFRVANLPGLDETLEVEPQGNAVHFTGFGLSDIAVCPKGFLSGIWRQTGDDAETDVVEAGVFKGRWIGLFGALNGFVRGAYGYDSGGERVFIGKYISRNGRFRGLLRGTWEPVPERPGHGRFRGRWINAAGTTEGMLGGQYLTMPERPGGFFAGRWATLCDDEAVGEIR